MWMTDLLELPGVGQYAANATLAVAFGEELRSSMASPPASTGGTSGSSHGPGLDRCALWDARRAGHPSTNGSGVELGRARSRGRGLPPEDPALRGVPSRRHVVPGHRRTVDRVRGPC